MATSDQYDEIRNANITLNGDDRGDWFEWQVDDSTACYVPAEISDLADCLAASFGFEGRGEAYKVALLRCQSVSEMLARLFKRGKREAGEEWTAEP